MKSRAIFRVIKRDLNNAPPFGMSYGPGGRSSNSGLTATVFGATGFVGKYFVDELGSAGFVFSFILNVLIFTFMFVGSCGSRVYVPYRGCEMEVRHLKVMFDHGQVKFISLLYFSR